MMEILAPHVHGQALAGAGGGGFMYLLSKAPHAAADLEALVRSQMELSDVKFHAVALDQEGLVVREEASQP
jgi:fucokinase